MMKTNELILKQRKTFCKELGKAIKSHKIDYEVNLSSICDGMGINNTQFYKILRGDSNARIDTLLLIADYLNLDIRLVSR